MLAKHKDPVQGHEQDVQPERMRVHNEPKTILRAGFGNGQNGAESAGANESA
jgi:hypothetical protein